jgi:hypothetical protein
MQGSIALALTMLMMGIAGCTSPERETLTSLEASGEASPRKMDTYNNCEGEATASVDGEERRVQIVVTPCRVVSGETPRTVLTNLGKTQVGYGPGFKLDRRVNGRWRWINRRQGFTLPLFYLEPGEKGEPESLAVYLGSPDPVELSPGHYRVTKGVQLAPGKPRPPTMNLRVNFRIAR